MYVGGGVALSSHLYICNSVQNSAHLPVQFYVQTPAQKSAQKSVLIDRRERLAGIAPLARPPRESALSWGIGDRTLC